MKHVLAATMAAVAAFAVAPAAQAAVFPVGSPNFMARPGPGGTFSANLGNSGIAAGTFTDFFTFTLPASGLGSGTVTTSTSLFGDTTDLDFTSVFINDIPVTIMRTAGPGGAAVFESASANGIPITAGVLNTLTVNGVSRGAGAYGGQISFIPTAGVPEPSTWALLLVGFGLTGAAMRYRRRSTKIAYA